MKKLIMSMMLLAAVCVNVFADNDRCGLRMSVNGYDGTEMLGCYQYVYLLPDEEFTRTITFDNVNTEKRYVVELRHLNRYVSNSDIASSKDFTLLKSDDLGITVEHVGFEGTVMQGCIPLAIFSVHNSLDKPVSLMKYMDWDGLCVYRVIEKEDGTVWYSQLGYMPDEDFVLEAGETKEAKFRVPMVKAGILHCCVGSFNYDNSDIPFEIFSYFDIDIAESRPWDLTAEINVRGLEEVDGRKLLADTNATVDIVITNNEDELYTPYQPFLSLYKMSNNTAVRYKAYNTGAHYLEPHTPKTFTINTSDVLKEQGVYYFAVETNNLLSTIGRSETFMVDTTLDIDNVSIASESSVEVYTTDGKLVATGDADNAMDGLAKGLYIIKDNQGTRKVMK